MNNAENILYLSSDKGVTWRQLTMGFTNGYGVALSYYGDIVSVAGNNGVYTVNINPLLGILPTCGKIPIKSILFSRIIRPFIERP